MKNVSLVIKGNEIRKVVDIISTQIDVVYKFESDNVLILMKEEPYFRVKSNLLSTYIFEFHQEDEAKIEIVTGGGRDELEMDWGCENSENKKIVENIITICKDNSYEVKEVYPDEFKEKLFKSIKDLAVEKFSKLMFKKK
ncbi:hypothetical protein R9X47_13715 [Wukongibacter baidiensis]|uniref:hypothetical protein n=1 Tax=Wukongibacter baidiensis TaxID=1723361 RepID=UPI003D7F207F